ncbi:MarR family winged helix-turn-helix transcriptional regulator [Salinicola avicenniae]|uniref:MarR family winged helix-turn-helix transcriptional regulator n=1 Tax=Salinicola avicenniae TaxID=2916836 RepID=UPI0020732D9E|nr:MULTISPECIES: MarR family transcriptional regulator [unclassified Salinicola]
MSDTSVGESLHQLMHAYKRALRRAYRESGSELAVSHIRTLKAVRTLSPCTAGEVAQCLQRDKAQITRLTRELVESGTVTRTANPADGRSQLLALTEAGEALLTRIDACERHVHADLARHLASEDLAAFVRLSRLMIDNLH